jgi:NADPH:quinone reductase-like Zn-dependent oxidoreductase
LARSCCDGKAVVAWCPPGLALERLSEVEFRAVSGPPAGTRVVGHADSGGWAEQVAVPTRRLAELPEEMPFVTAAALPWPALRRFACCASPGRSQAGRFC